MGKTKENIFTSTQLRKAKLAKALGHPARIAILEYIVCHEPCNSVILSEKISLSQSTLAQHLKLLKTGGLLKVETIGKKTRYFINDALWNETIVFFLATFDRYKKTQV